MILTATRIRELLVALNAELANDDVRGEMFLAGGAVMCLVFRAREATKDIDAVFMPAAELRRAARRVAEREELPQDWLNDAVKGFFSAVGRFEVFCEMTHLRIFAPHPEYLLAMKCLAMRMGEEFQDRSDVALLLQILGLTTLAGVEAILSKYYPMERYPVRARYILEEMLASSHD